MAAGAGLASHRLRARWAARPPTAAHGRHLAPSGGADASIGADAIFAHVQDRKIAGLLSLHADVLLVPHHGSKTSSSDAFLDAVHPSWAIVQAGYRNRFGHPAAPVLERYRRLGVPVIDSPHCGAAYWRSDQPGRVACQRETAPRYWHHRFP